MENYGQESVNCVQAVFEYRCADSRDRGWVEMKVANAMVRWYGLANTKVIRKSIVGAGVFATMDVIDGIMRGIHRNIAMGMEEKWWPFREEAPKGWTPMRFVVQVNTHADARLKDAAGNDAVVHPASEVVFERHSSINCGMGHAADVYNDLMEFVKGRLQIRKCSSLVVVDSTESMLEFLQQAYGFEGESPEDFIKPINDHEMHVVKQARKIENALRSSFQLKDTDWVVNRGITNYRTGEVIRIDSNEGVYTIMDDIARMNATILAMLPNSHPEKARRVEKQAPVALLLCSPNLPHPRNTLLEIMGGEAYSIATPGSVFALSGYDINSPTYPFGPYRVLSIFYAVKHLGIKDIYLVGEGDGEINAMYVKMMRDPIVRLILEEKELGVKVHRVNCAACERRTSVNATDPLLKDALIEGRRAFFRKLHPKSTLNRLPPERLKKLQTA